MDIDGIVTISMLLSSFVPSFLDIARHLSGMESNRRQQLTELSPTFSQLARDTVVDGQPCHAAAPNRSYFIGSQAEVIE